jgi:hypothetical protein
MKNKNKNKIIFVSLNELNFELIENYLKNKKFINFSKIKKNLTSTTSEKNYKLLEPWIQWVSIYYGKSAKDHGVFRLGEKIDKKFKSIFKVLEEKNLKVGAISPMNVHNNLKSPSFFIPDPWSETKPDNNFWSKLINVFTSTLVKDNVRKKINIKSYFYLILCFLKFVRFKRYYLFIKIFLKSRKKKWFKAIFLDLFLHEFHMNKLKKSNVDFSNIFFNSIAHIQHHYFFNSRNKFDKKFKNPKWYIKKNDDPLKDTLEIFEIILDDYFKKYKEYTLIVATGLSQVPYDTVKYYYRLKNHKFFFDNFGVKFKKILELMSRDFFIKFKSKKDALNNIKLIKNIETLEGEKIFSDLQIKGKDLFLTLNYNKEIKNQIIKNKLNQNIKLVDFVDFVAIKNGKHHGKGYLYMNNRLKKKKVNIIKIKEKIINLF